MTSDIDIYRSANLLVKQHSEDAPIEAAMRADAMLEAGDLDGYATWKRILRAVAWVAPPSPRFTLLQIFVVIRRDATPPGGIPTWRSNSAFRWASSM